MTNAEIVAALYNMVDRFAAMLDEPMVEGTLPTVRITFKPDGNGERMTLTVGAEFAERTTP